VFLARHVQLKDKKYLMLFINTAVINILLSLIIIIISLYFPESIRSINIGLFFWLLSGVFLLLMLLIQLLIFRRVYQRSKLPENYHYNFFGKKVLHSSVLKQTELFMFFGTIPLLVLSGAYFTARLINIILYGHL
jgi:hypothetical protein